MIHQLLNRGANPKIQDSQGWNALHFAFARQRDHTILARLVALGIDLRTQMELDDKVYGCHALPACVTVLHMTAFTGDLEATRLILEAAKGASHGLTKASNGPATEYGFRIGSFIDTGADGSRITALMVAARGGHVVVAKPLLEPGADVNISGGSSSWGVTMLDMARTLGNKKITELIKANGGEEFN